MEWSIIMSQSKKAKKIKEAEIAYVEARHAEIQRKKAAGWWWSPTFSRWMEPRPGVKVLSD